MAVYEKLMKGFFLFTCLRLLSPRVGRESAVRKTTLSGVSRTVLSWPDDKCPLKSPYRPRTSLVAGEGNILGIPHGGLDEARASIQHFIEEVYTQKRLHSSLGYLSPDAFERQQRTDSGVGGGSAQ